MPVNGETDEEADQASSNKSQEISLEKLKSRAESGDAEAQFEVGLMYHDDKNTANSEKKTSYWITKSAENGFLPAQAAMVILYKAGIGVEKDIKKEIWWLRLTAIRGVVDSQYQLGQFQSNTFISDKYDIPYSPREGIRWLENAAEEGHVEAMLSLGKIYRDGSLVEKKYKDVNKAMYWLNRAKDNGSKDAEEILKKLESV